MNNSTVITPSKARRLPRSRIAVLVASMMMLLGVTSAAQAYSGTTYTPAHTSVAYWSTGSQGAGGFLLSGVVYSHTHMKVYTKTGLNGWEEIKDFYGSSRLDSNPFSRPLVKASSSLAICDSSGCGYAAIW